MLHKLATNGAADGTVQHNANAAHTALHVKHKQQLLGSENNHLNCNIKWHIYMIRSVGQDFYDFREIVQNWATSRLLSLPCCMLQVVFPNCSAHAQRFQQAAHVAAIVAQHVCMAATAASLPTAMRNIENFTQKQNRALKPWNMLSKLEKQFMRLFCLLIEQTTNYFSIL